MDGSSECVRIMGSPVLVVNEVMLSVREETEDERDTYPSSWIVEIVAFALVFRVFDRGFRFSFSTVLEFPLSCTII